MKTRALAVLVPLLVLAGCTEDNNVSIQVAAICAPPEDSCTFEATCTLQYLGRNRLDVAQGTEYWSFLETHNQLLDNSDESAGRPNTHDAQVREFSVEFEVTPPLTTITSTGATVTVALPAFRGNVLSGPEAVPADGSAVVAVQPIPAAIGTIIRGALTPGEGHEVLAKVRLHGVFADQSDFETAEFPIPVEVCSGCVGVPACADPAQIVVGVCPQAGQLPASVICQ